MFHRFVDFNLPKTVSALSQDDIIAIISTLSGGCDFKDENHVATFKAGTKMTTFKLNITDDDIFEGPELFNFAIVSTSHSQVRRCPSRFRGSVTITDDEKGKCYMAILIYTFLCDKNFAYNNKYFGKSNLIF